MDYSIVGERVKERRKAKRMSQTVLGSHLGVSSSSVSLYEQGKVPMSTDQLLKAANVLGAPTQYFTGEMSFEELLRRDEIRAMPSNIMRHQAERDDARAMYRRQLLEAYEELPPDLCYNAVKVVEALFPEYHSRNVPKRTAP